MLKQFIIAAIASGFLTSLCPVCAQSNDKKNLESFSRKQPQCHKSNLVDQATKVGASPLTLLPTSDENSANLAEEQRTEKEILTALWEAAFERSPDILFLISRLLPNGDRKKTTKVLFKSLSSLLYTGIGSLGMIAPARGMHMQVTMAMVDPALEPDYPTYSSYLKLPAYELPKHANRMTNTIIEKRENGSKFHHQKNS